MTGTVNANVSTAHPMTPAPASFLRLRQICLVAQELEPTVDTLCEVLGLHVCHRDAGVERFGLHNALMRIGSSFIEVVAPLPGPRGQNTAATRHLARLGGDGGYMVILDTDAIAPWRAHAAALGIREASFHQVAGYTGLQLHPRDTGGTLLEINHSEGNAALDGPYWPAGPHWQDAPDSAVCVALQGATVSGVDANRLSQRWAALLQRQAVPSSATGIGTLSQSPHRLLLDNAAALAFRSVPAHENQGLTGLQVAVRDWAGLLKRASALGLPNQISDAAASVVICGVTWQLKLVPPVVVP